MSLRGLVLAAGAVCLAASVVLWLVAVPTALILLFWAVVLIAGTVYERVIYKPLESQAGAGWDRHQRTLHRRRHGQDGDGLCPRTQWRA